MNTRLPFIISLALTFATLPLRAELPSTIITPACKLVPGRNDAAWGKFLATLKAKGSILAAFEEDRFFAFKKNPVVLTGEIRLDPVRGMSLHYQVPEERILVVDDRGGFMRDGKGRRLHDLPDDPRAQAATRALLHVMRFELDALAKDFAIYAARDGADWRFAFVPLPGPLTDVLQPITITGKDDLVTAIEMKKSDDERVEIKIGETHTGVTFNSTDINRYFR
ncbi:MAG TPA: hypothetical protein VL357_02295 [Rariglobus sp.]|jgi:hypothetical protein|nr:hypothetical protein [Rariglobus sp.]